MPRFFRQLGLPSFPISAKLTLLMQATETTWERIPAPPELAEKAEELVRAFHECFWFWHPEARVRYWDDLPLVVEHLRDYGNKKAWRAAQDLQRCL